jgi:hypothetical protein
VRRRPDRDVLEVVGDELAGQRVEVLQALDLVAEERRPEGRLGVGGEDLERLAAHAERAAPEAWSLREYWIETSLRSRPSRSTSSRA